MSNLTFLDLNFRGNNLGTDICTIICKNIANMNNLITLKLDFSSNNLGFEGAR